MNQEARYVAAYHGALVACRAELRAFIDNENCHPILVRLAWHDSGTFDQAAGTGGANGSIRFDRELAHDANAGLKKAVGFLRPFKHRFPVLSWADIIQLASAESIELAGGPRIPMRYGRFETSTAAECPVEGNLPDAMLGAQHLRDVFHRMGFGDRDIVALSGAHTLGRAFKERSGAVEEGYGAGTKFTGGATVARGDYAPGVGMAGGRSWTPEWLSFDNSYFKYIHRKMADAGSQSQLAWFPTDTALHTDDVFKRSFEEFATSQTAFFKAYAPAHAQLSSLGSTFFPARGIAIDYSLADQAVAAAGRSRL